MYCVHVNDYYCDTLWRFYECYTIWSFIKCIILLSAILYFAAVKIPSVASVTSLTFHALFHHWGDQHSILSQYCPDEWVWSSGMLGNGQTVKLLNTCWVRSPGSAWWAGGWRFDLARCKLTWCTHCKVFPTPHIIAAVQINNLQWLPQRPPTTYLLFTGQNQ